METVNNSSNNSEPLYEQVSNMCNTTRRQVTQAINTATIESYWAVGRYIVEYEQQGNARADYGDETIKRLSSRLTIEYGQGFTVANLKFMRQFYLCYPQGLGADNKLSWTHLRSLLKVDSDAARSFYQTKCVANNWSTRELDYQISRKLYERVLEGKVKEADEYKEAAEKNHSTSASTKPLKGNDVAVDLNGDPFALNDVPLNLNGVPAKSSHITSTPTKPLKGNDVAFDLNGAPLVLDNAPIDLKDVPLDPYVKSLTGFDEEQDLTTYDPKEKLLNKLFNFLLNCDQGFGFEARNKLLMFDNKRRYVDLVFYNFFFKYSVLIDLKLGKISKKDIAKMQEKVDCFTRIPLYEGNKGFVGMVISAAKTEHVVELVFPEGYAHKDDEPQLDFLPTKEELYKLLWED